MRRDFHRSVSRATICCEMCETSSDWRPETKPEFFDATPQISDQEGQERPLLSHSKSLRRKSN